MAEGKTGSSSGVQQAAWDGWMSTAEARRHRRPTCERLPLTEAQQSWDSWLSKSGARKASSGPAITSTVNSLTEQLVAMRGPAHSQKELSDRYPTSEAHEEMQQQAWEVWMLRRGPAQTEQAAAAESRAANPVSNTQHRVAEEQAQIHLQLALSEDSIAQAVQQLTEVLAQLLQGDIAVRLHIWREQMTHPTDNPTGCCCWGTKSSGVPPPELVFDSHDTDRDGFLSREQLRDAIQMQEQIDEQQAAQLVDSLFAPRRPPTPRPDLQGAAGEAAAAASVNELFDLNDFLVVLKSAPNSLSSRSTLVSTS